jgi:predicted glycosyltransferase
MNISLQQASSLRKVGPSDRLPIATPRGKLTEGQSTCRPVVFLYSHDTFGLGHLRRNLAIIQRLLGSSRAFEVHLLTGSPVISQWKLPPDLHVHPLPPVVKTGVERYEARDGAHCFGLVKGYREATIVRLVMEHRPDVFLVDHAPAGMNGELLGPLAVMRREMPHTRLMLGLRDILDAPGTVRAIWAEQDIPRLIEQAYDDVLVYGSRAHFDVVEGYGMDARLAGRVRYCGHVVAARESGAETGARPCWSPGRAAGRPVVLVTAGGGGDGHFLMKAYLEALNRCDRVGHHSAVVTGPLMSAEEREGLQRQAAGRSDVELIEYTTDLVPSLRAADLIVSMAGYNTSAEIIAERRKAILVPRAAPRAEQRLRAGLLARLGVVRCVDAGPDLADRLARQVPEALGAPGPSEEAWDQLDLDGADRTADYIAALTHPPLAAEPLAAAGAQA